MAEVSLPGVWSVLPCRKRRKVDVKWFAKKKPAARAPQVQLRDVEHHPFGVLDRYVPLRRGELDLYRSIREAVPIVDAAILKLVRLCGGVIVQQGAPPRRLRQGGATRMQGRMEAIRGNGFSERAPMRALGRRLHAGHAQERTAFGPPRCGPQAIYGFRPATPRVASSQWPAASGLPRPFRGRAPRACSEAAPRPSSAWNWHP